jgi:propionate catabolism operon transcriptional regulator
MLYEQFKKLKVRGNIIPLRVQTNDFYKALVNASKYSNEVNVINYQKEYIQTQLNYINDEHDELDRIFKIKVNQFTYRNKEEAEELVKRLHEAGQKVVIGSGLVVRFAKELGMEGILWFGKESVGLAVDIAFNSKDSRAKQPEKAKLYFRKLQ